MVTSPPMTVKESRLRKILLTVLSLVGAIGLYESFSLTTDHLNSTNFTDHAKFHAVLSGLYMLALTLVLILLIWGLLRRAQQRFEPLLVFILLALPGAVLLAAAIVPSGSPPFPLVVFAGIMLMVSIFLGVLVWRLRRYSS